jgi:hypothetical protein
VKLINADEFLWKLEDYAITDADRDFCEKVKFALDKEPPVNVIPIEFLNVLAKTRPGMISATISLIKDKWGKEREKDGQVESEHSGSSQGAENVAADRPPFDGVRPAPDRGLRTAEGLQPNGLFCIQKNAGRRKGTARDRIVEAVRKIDELIETAEPIEEIDDICRKTANITECANMITENLVAKNYQRIITLAESCDLFADRANDSGENVAMMMRRIMKLVGEIRAALAMPAEKED